MQVFISVFICPFVMIIILLLSKELTGSEKKFLYL